MMSLPRASAESSGGITSPIHQNMSPRLPRKSRYPGAYASTSKLDHPASLQMEQYSEGRISPITLASPGNSPYSNRPNRRDRAFDRYGSLDLRQSHEHKSRDKFSSLDRTVAMSRYGYRDHRDRSIERTGADYGGKPSSLQRNRSLDRDYPLVSLSMRSLADQADSDIEADLRYQQSQSSMLILSLQTQLVDLNKDYTIAQRELEQSKSQLNSYIASIKTFWSPELKKERSLRKEETQKCSKAQETLNTAQHEVQVLEAKLQNAEERLKLQGIRESASPDCVTATNIRDNERQEKEIQILQNTVSEMELRIEIQKKTLAARDASIKKLVEMLQSKNIPIETILSSEAEKDKLRNEIATLERDLLDAKNELKLSTIESTQLQKNVSDLKNELNEAQTAISRANRESKNLDDVQALLDIKNTRISELEAELKDLENQIANIRDISSEKVNEEKRHIETLHSHEKVLKSKLENLKVELSGKTTEIGSLQGRLDTLHNQKSDLEQQLDTLKQHMSTKDSNIQLLQSEVSQLNSMIEEKDCELDKRSAQVEAIKTDKIQLEADLTDTRYEVEVSSRKLTLTQKKLDNVEDQLRDRGDEILSLESQISSLLADRSNNETIEQLKKSLDEKNKLIDKMKEQIEAEMSDRQSEASQLEKINQELRRDLDLFKQSAQDKENEMLGLQESISELRSARLKTESQLHQSEKTLTAKSSENEELKATIDQLRSETSSQSGYNSEQQMKIEQLTQNVTEQSEQVQKYQSEIDRLLDILKEMEHEKHNKDKQIRELQEQLKETKQKFVTLKKSQQQADRKRLDENKKLGLSDTNGDIHTRMRRDKERIEELEEALKQSVKITTKCEMDVARQKEEIDKKNKLLEQYKTDVAKATEISMHYREMEKMLQKRNEQIHKLLAEKNQHMEEVYEMKQEAILAAISEKDSHIALLEASKAKNTKEDVERLTSEKQKLNSRLKELVTQRMHLVVEQSSDPSRLLNSNQGPKSMKKDET